MSTFAHFVALDRALVAKGFHPTSPWWLETLARFYASGRRQLVIRAGRRAGKSSTLCRIAVLEALFGAHAVPTGDVGIVGIVSVSRDEAASRLRTIRAILDVLGVGYRERDQTIELTSRPVVFKVFAATLASVVGGTWIAAICDEVARWRDADSGANPATDVLASLRPALATQPNAKLFLSSSPLGTDDAHATAFDTGETGFQVVAHAPTWVANPSPETTEDACRALEPDERIFLREYGAEPQAGLLAAFDAAAIARAFEPRIAVRRSAPVVVFDPSSGRKDSATWAALGWARDASGEAFVEVRELGGIEGAFWKQVSGDEMVSRVVAFCERHDVRDVHADQREAFMLASAFQKHGFRYVVHDWTATSKPVAVERVRTWLRDRQLGLPPHETLRRELLAFEERVTSSGALTFGARGTGHDDYVALLLTAGLAEVAGELDGSIARGIEPYESFRPHPPMSIAERRAALLNDHVSRRSGGA